MAEKQNEISSVRGTISRITYQHPETHYTVARLDEDGGPAFTVVGTLFPVAEGEELKVTGSWKRHPRYGLQFQVDHWEKIDPATVEGIEKYLGSGLIKGIGPTYAKRLVDAFGLDTLRVLSEEPLRILDVDGIGEVRARRVMQAWQDQRGMQDVMVFLQGHGVGASLALRIYRVFGADTINQVRENPYALARQVHGIGFLLGGPPGASHRHPRRFSAARASRCVACAARNGRPRSLLRRVASLKRNAAALLNIEEDAVEAAVDKLAAKHELVLQEAGVEGVIQVYLEELYHAERRVAAAFQSLLATPSFLQGEVLLGPWSRTGANERGAIDLTSPELFGPSTLTLDPDQVRATEQAVREKVLVITGGPGTGKTTLLTALLTILRRAEARFRSGRAHRARRQTHGRERR